MAKIFIDLEVTSFCKEYGAIHQISLIDEDGNEFDTYIDPFTYNREIKVNQANLERCGILTTQTLLRGDYASEVVSRIIGFLEGKKNCTLVGHNASAHDIHYLNSLFKDSEIDFKEYFNYEVIDTLQYARALRGMGKLGYDGSLSLKPLCKHFKIDVENWHNSLDDVRAVKKLYEELKNV